MKKIIKNNDDKVPLARVGVVSFIGLIIFAITALVLIKQNENNLSTIYVSSLKENLVEETIQVAEVTSRSEVDRSEEVTAIEDNYLINDAAKIVEEIKNETTVIAEEEINNNLYIKIEDVTISRDMDLTVRTGLSKKDFVTLIENCRWDTSGFFRENAEYIYDLCEEYSLNEIFFCGLISAESGWNIAGGHRSTHNYISLMSNGHLISYSTTEEGLRVAAQKLHNNYLTPGGSFYYGKTLSAVNTKFCGSDTWVGLVYGRMQQLL